MVKFLEFLAACLTFVRFCYYRLHNYTVSITVNVFCKCFVVVLLEPGSTGNDKNRFYEIEIYIFVGQGNAGFVFTFCCHLLACIEMGLGSWYDVTLQ